ncbi:hypothetical protein G5V57_26490 [Nordella sp. HKS 07]|uniref:hypothetical protein n=1 Tax=Nordella sp. HKS 07 TaxID=2712222 RepID=UPI0013E15DCA|nr:hypothetical protein [Nordella sp. HKS 07]QIG50967.1 hypothetical protein G5V57_26490 [Nordella sp. HKS 07]
MGGRRHTPHVAVSKRLVARPAIWAMILLALAAVAILIHGGAFAKKAYFDQAASRGQAGEEATCELALSQAT